VFCESEDDVAACIKYVQEWDLEMVIACGGHSFYGASSTQGFVIGKSLTLILIGHPD
jgi:FAD/FMN-containing dehydrogenase